MNFKQQVYALFLKVYELVFGQPKPVGPVAELAVEAHVINPPRQRDGQIYQYQNCPDILWASKLENGWYTIRLMGQHVKWLVTELGTTRVQTAEKYDWVNYPIVQFMMGRTSGIIYEIRVDAKTIMKRGASYFTGHNLPDWPYYINSVILAHLETVKFTNRRLFSHPVLVSKVLTNYGAQVFEELIDETSG